MAEPDRPAILVVDASPFFRRGIADALAARGHACRAAADLAGAAADLADPAVGLWILDLPTVGDAGVDLLRAVRSERPATRALVLAGHAAEPRVLDALRAGAEAYLAKPLHEEELGLAVERALAGWRADTELAALREASVAGEPETAAAADLDLARDLCEAVVGEGDPTTLPARLLARLAERLPAAGAALYLVEPGQGSFVREAVWEAGPVVDRPWLPPRRGLTGAAAATGVFVATADPAADPRFDPEVDAPAPGASGEGDLPAEGAPGGLLCLPLRFRGNTVGLVRVHLARAEGPSLRTAEIAGAALSAALRTWLLYRSWRSSIDEVARIRRESAARPGSRVGPGRRPTRAVPSPPGSAD
jgi:DNA-binding NarL/FixJ family response regulator